MSFPFVNKNLRLNILKARTAMNEKISVFVICVETIIYLLLHNLHDCDFKGAATDMRYFARSKFSRSLVHKKHFSLIWPVDDKDMYFAKRGRIPLLSLNELGEKSHATIILGKFCKQAIMKLSLAYSFRKMFFIGQNLNHVHMTYSFLELLIFFWWTQVDIYSLEFISHHITEILYLKTNSKRNQSWNKNKHFHLFL